MRFSRRSFLTLPLAGPVFTQTLRAQNRAFNPDIEFELTAAPGEHQILAGKPTVTWSYTAKQLKGRAGAVGSPVSYLGPPLRFKRGDKVRAHLINGVREETIVHWHGLNVPEKADGHPRLAIPPGGRYTYEFEIIDRAGCYWYHPHPHEKTATQAYRGLAGPIFINDDEEAALNLPSGDHEIPVVIQDRRFDSNQQLSYIDNHMEYMTGFLGDQILVNGKANTELSLGTGVYRLRFMNGSNARIYKLAWSPTLPITLIGTEGGLLAAPKQKPFLTLSPGERADVILDLSQRNPGDSLELRSLPFPVPRIGMMNMQPPGPPLGAPFQVLSVRVTHKEQSSFRLPARLSEPRFREAKQAVNATAPRIIDISFMRMNLLLNGAQFEMDAVKENEIFKAGQTYIIEMRNHAMGMMQMAHPMHFHGGQFQVLERSGGNTDMQRALTAGLMDEGWKDTVLVFPGEAVRILMPMPAYKGIFLYHCHILEHEDSGMMRNFKVV